MQELLDRMIRILDKWLLEKARIGKVFFKLEKYFSNSCFLEQPFVKDPDHSIKQLLHAASQEVGSELTVESFIRFQVGEDS